MCFVIAGVQPRTKQLEETPRRCPQCGLHQAYLQQVDSYISLFFIPLLRVKQGEPHLYCRRCQQPVGTGAGVPPYTASGPEVPMCRQCRRTIQAGYRYCPHCGEKQS